MDFALIIKLLPYVFQLMGLAEKYFGSGAGVQKKELVMEASKVAIAAVTDVSGGGQKETWLKYGPALSGVIDSVVPVLFPKEDERNN